MQSDQLQRLRERFGAPGVRFEVGAGGMAKCVLSYSDAEAEVYLHGAHVTHFRPVDAAPLLFVSRQSRFEPGAPIRGGVPICFPWFGDHPGAESRRDLPAHGFARTREWAVADAGANERGEPSVTFRLSADDATRRLWPHDFAADYAVTLGPHALEMSLRVRNTGGAAFTFEAALHTYFAVADVRRVGVRGLAGHDYLDKTDGLRRKTEADGPARIVGETDRVYVRAPGQVAIDDEAAGRVILNRKVGSRSTVLWNPWAAKAARMGDFGDDEWPSMLCVETANVGDAAITLAPGASHAMAAHLMLK